MWLGRLLTSMRCPDMVYRNKVSGTRLLSSICLMCFAVVAAMLGYFVGYTLTFIIIASQSIASLPLIYIILMVLLMLAILQILDMLNVTAIVNSLRLTIKSIILVNSLTVLLPIVYVIMFNLLNSLLPHNLLLKQCHSMRTLTDQEIVLLNSVVIIIFTLSNLLFSMNVLLKFLGFPLYIEAEKAPKSLKNIVTLSNIIRAIKASVMVIVILSLLLYPIVNFRYQQMVCELKRTFIDKCEASVDPVYCMWMFVKDYNGSFEPTYRKPCPKPRQLLIIIASMNNRIFIAKLAAVTQTGACLDFALGITKLVKDIYGYETRIVSMLGIDHVIPEVKIGNTWYVIDIACTTKSYPVKVNEYARYLQQRYPEIYGRLKGLVDFSTGIDLSDEHGFSV